MSFFYDLKTMMFAVQVHFLAVGSNEEYEKLLKSPEQLAAVIKTALKNGQSLMVEGDSRSSLSAVKVQLEHSHLTDRLNL